LIHAAAGGVGLLLVQMAKEKGANVIGTVSTPEKAELVRSAGADHTILYISEDFEEKTNKLTEGRGVDVVYESVGKNTFEKSLNCLTRRGYMVLYGQSSGPVEPLDPQVLNQKGSIFLTRPSLFDYVSNGEEFMARANDILSLIKQDRLKIRIGERLPLSDAKTAHQKLEARQTTGKILLTT
jgi:NADPH2:quinone reductase